MQTDGDKEAGNFVPNDVFEIVGNKEPKEVAKSLVRCLKYKNGEIIKESQNSGNHRIFKCWLNENYVNGETRLENGTVVTMKQFDSHKEAEKEYNIPAFCIHDNIVTVFSLTYDLNKPCYIMEYSECSLYGFLHYEDSNRMYPNGESGYSLQHCIGFSKQIASALKFLHEEGIMHGDVKSGNILLFEDNTVCKLCDFDHSQHINSKDLKKVCGTTGYMAPEIGGYQDACFPPKNSNSSPDTSIEAMDGPAYSEKIDNYSFGVLMLELSFRRNVGGLAANLVQNYGKPGPLVPFHVSKFTELQDFNHPFNEMIWNLIQRDPNERVSFEDVGNHFNSMNCSLPMRLKPMDANIQGDVSMVKNRSQRSSEKVIEYTISRADSRKLTDEDAKKICFQKTHRIEINVAAANSVGISLRGDEKIYYAQHCFKRLRNEGNVWIMEHKIAGENKAHVYNYCYNNQGHCRQLATFFDEKITFKVNKPTTYGAGAAVELIEMHQERSQRSQY